jgi:hypothetical protein
MPLIATDAPVEKLVQVRRLLHRGRPPISAEAATDVEGVKARVVRLEPDSLDILLTALHVPSLSERLSGRLRVSIITEPGVERETIEVPVYGLYE